MNNGVDELWRGWELIKKKRDVDGSKQNKKDEQDLFYEEEEVGTLEEDWDSAALIRSWTKRR